MKRYWIGLLVGVFILAGCDFAAQNPAGEPQVRFSERWQTYRNSRFGYEFLYPDGWIDSIPPENRDGIAFTDPKNLGLEIRAWAELKRSHQSKLTNFTTEQGLPGNLAVKVEAQTSSMTLMIYQDDVEYHWRGTAPSQQFGNYYQFFSYIVSRYRVAK